MANDSAYIKEKNINVLIIDDENPKKTKFIFNDYKTASSFGKQTVANMPDQFLKILYEYLEYNNLKQWDF